MGKQSVRAHRRNWDVDFLRDITTGNGFIISEPPTFQFDDKKEKSLHGPRSILYGTSYEDETAFIERCRCECGAFKGLMFEGETCPICGQKVEKREVNIEYTGWISLHKDYVINPFYYNKFNECFGKIGGKSAIQDIITPKRIVDVNGHCRLAKPHEIDEHTKNPFIGIGTDEFRNRFYEICDWFMEKKKKKAPEIKRLKDESRAVFTSHIPVYSTFLRPSSMTPDTFYFNSIDKQINPIYSLSDKLPKSEEIDKALIRYNIQRRLNKLWDENFSLLNGKEGIIRGQILGGSLNNTSRKLITLRGNEAIHYTNSSLIAGTCV